MSFTYVINNIHARNNFCMKGQNFAKYEGQLFFTKPLVIRSAMNDPRLFTACSPVTSL